MKKKRKKERKIKKKEREKERKKVGKNTYSNGTNSTFIVVSQSFLLGRHEKRKTSKCGLKWPHNFICEKLEAFIFTTFAIVDKRLSLQVLTSSLPRDFCYILSFSYHTCFFLCLPFSPSVLLLFSHDAFVYLSVCFYTFLFSFSFLSVTLIFLCLFYLAVYFVLHFSSRFCLYWKIKRDLLQFLHCTQQQSEVQFCQFQTDIKQN